MESKKKIRVVPLIACILIPLAVGELLALWAMILFLILSARKIDKRAVLCLLPYIFGAPLPRT